VEPTLHLGASRLQEVKNNAEARRSEAMALAESSYPLRRLRRLGEARERIDAAFVLLRDTKDYPARQLNPESAVVAALRAQAGYESQVGDRRRAVEIYEQLLSAMMASKPDPFSDLMDANKVSILHDWRLPARRRGREGRGYERGPLGALAALGEETAEQQFHRAPTEGAKRIGTAPRGTG
jgi:hypothetical protein